MDHIKILKRAWNITWGYRALWIFGIILALTTGGGGGGNGGGGGGNGGRYNGGNGGNGLFPGDFHMPEIPAEAITIAITVGIALACLVLFMMIIGTVARYVAETSLIRMVDEHEATGEKHTVGQGFRLGWSRAAFRLFLIDLVIGLPIAIVFIGLFVLAAAPLFLWMTENTTVGVLGTISAIGLFFLFILAAIVVGVVVGVLTHFFRRTCALEGTGVFDSIRQGYGLVRRHLKDVAIMVLIMFGIGIGWGIVLVIVTLVLMLAGLFLAALPALMVGGLVSLFAEGPTPWILAALVGLPILMLLVGIPSLFLSGLMQVYVSSVWTLTYRDLRAMEALSAGEVEGEVEEIETEPTE